VEIRWLSLPTGLRLAARIEEYRVRSFDKEKDGSGRGTSIAGFFYFFGYYSCFSLSYLSGALR